jgi:hypothetical protein
MSRLLHTVRFNLLVGRELFIFAQMSVLLFSLIRFEFMMLHHSKIERGSVVRQKTRASSRTGKFPEVRLISTQGTRDYYIFYYEEELKGDCIVNQQYIYRPRY